LSCLLVKKHDILKLNLWAELPSFCDITQKLIEITTSNDPVMEKSLGES
jgi:hypothetical protein